MLSRIGGFSTPFMTRILLNPEGDGGGGTGTGEQEKPPTKTPSVDETVKKHGSAEAAVLWLLTRDSEKDKDNFKQREEIRTLRAQLPASGSRVLTADEAAEFDRYRSLGKPETITTTMKERDDLAKRVAKSDRDMKVRQVAKANKWDEDVFADIVKDEDFIEIENKDKDGNTVKGEDGKPERIWAIKGATDADAPTPVKDRYARLLPSLAPKSEEEDGVLSPSREFRRIDSRAPDGSEKRQAPLFTG